MFLPDPDGHPSPLPVMVLLLGSAVLAALGIILVAKATAGGVTAVGWVLLVAGVLGAVTGVGLAVRNVRTSRRIVAARKRQPRDDAS